MGEKQQGPPSRSRNGCLTCRDKKVKCGEERPSCHRCSRLELNCNYSHRPRKKYTKRQPQPPPPPLIQPQIQSGGDSHVATSPTPPPPPLIQPQIQSGGDSHVATSPTTQSSLTNTSVQHPGRLSILDLELDLGATQPTPEGGNLRDGPGTDPLLFEGICSSCTSIIGPREREAIACYRRDISATVDTKDASYSVPAVIWEIAKSRPTVLHMICALGCVQLGHQAGSNADPNQDLRIYGARHYGKSMTLLAELIDDISDSSILDAVLATLWLMIIYEQKFGDGWGEGLNTHLIGAASVLRSRLGNLKSLRTVPGCDEEFRPSSPLSLELSASTPWLISPFSGRLIVWISFLDSGAAFFGLGGHFNQSLGEVMEVQGEDSTISRLEGFSRIHKYSTLLCSSLWGDAYPQEQRFEDIENRESFYFYGQIGQLRFIITDLAKTRRQQDHISLAIAAQNAARAIRFIGEKYSELIGFAPQMNYRTARGRERKFISNLRFIVPHYYAVVLCYYRITRPRSPLGGGQLNTLQKIMNLASRISADEGDHAMTRIAWPLFIAGLETMDLVYREWIITQFSRLSEHGENYYRAYLVLKSTQAADSDSLLRENYLDAMAGSIVDKFVI